MSFVRAEFEGALAILVLSRPEAGNAVSPELVHDLGLAVNKIERACPRAILIRAEGNNFSFGGDIQHLAAQGERVAEVLTGMAEGVHTSLLKLRRVDAPIVCAARGHVLGGGLGIALSGDFLVLSDSAKASTAYARLGFSADAGVSYFLTRAVGVRRATAMLMDSRFLSAPELLSLGIADRVIADSELDAAALKLAHELAEGPTAAYAAIRKLTEAALTNDLATHLDLETQAITSLARCNGVAEDLRAVLEKRKPAFTASNQAREVKLWPDSILNN